MILELLKNLLVLGLFAEATALRCWIVSFSPLDPGLFGNCLVWSGLDEGTGGDSISIVFASVVSANKDIMSLWTTPSMGPFDSSADS